MSEINFSPALIFEATPVAIIVVDDAGRIASINAQVERLFGYERDELVGETIEQLVPQRFRAAHPMLRRGFTGAPAARPMGAGRDLFALRKDGSEIPVEIGLSPLQTAEGTFVLATIVDISERKHAEELRLLSVGERRRRLDAEADRDRALEVSQLKSQFVATMSHELRTPLSAIIGLTELLAADELGPVQRSHLEKINESAEVLLGLINGILDLSKIEAGKLELDVADFQLAAVVGRIAAILGQQARRKGLTFRTSLDPSLSRTLRGDRERLTQILLNLVGNAIKFTERGEVTLRAMPLERDAGATTVRFEIEDTGPGIAAAALPRLFEPFVQADSSASRKYGGTGLGLSISKRLIELMDGQIGVSSELGRGSLFWFTARLGAVVQPDGATSAEPSTERPKSSLPILLAEDNPGLHEVLAAQFRQLGFELRIVTDGAQAVAALEREQFAMVFMDCRMPNVDGFEATRLIRHQERANRNHVPIIAMTANAFKEDREACIAAGMDDYLAKPVRLKELREVADRWLVASGAPRAPRVGARSRPSTSLRTSSAAESPSDEGAPDVRSTSGQ